MSAAIDAYRFNDAADAAYRFVWNVFCDWYVELAKPLLQGDDGAEKDETRATTAFVLDQIYALLHPFMPFITEELWAIKGARRPLARERCWRLPSGRRSRGSKMRRPRAKSAGSSISSPKSARCAPR